MRTSIKLSLTGLVAALLLSVTVGAASARNLSISNTNARITWSRLEFVAPITARCQITLEGSFHARTAAKVVGSLVGSVTRATVKTESCTNGRVVASNVPWHITYEGFRGTLPNISDVLLLIRDFLFKIERAVGTALECSYGTASDNLTAALTLNAGMEAVELRPVAGRNTVNLLEARNEEVFVRCPATGGMVAAAGDGVVRLLASSTTRIRVTLI
jgi:hypothetical protein